MGRGDDDVMKRGKFSKECIVSVLILAATGLFMHTMSHGEDVPLRKQFADFPLSIDQWSGKEFELGADVLNVLKVDDYLMRQYWNEQGASLGLYVGFYQSQRQGATYHSPRNCLPGSGWSFVKTEKTDLDVSDHNGQAIEINKVVIQKGMDKLMVLYWYQDRGRIIANEYWAKIYLVWDAITQNRTDGALVRVTLPLMAHDEEVVLNQGKTFAEKIFPLLRDYLPS